MGRTYIRQGVKREVKVVRIGSDVIIADEEFDIQETIAKRGILLNIPPRLEPRQQQIPALDIERTRINIRIHVE